MKWKAEPADRSPENRPKATCGRGAFTLLEVLAAVAILGIWYVVLAEASIQGLREEGTNRRILEAALIADSRLAEVEASLLDGTAPAPSESTSERDGFDISVKVAKFDFGLDKSAVPGPEASGSPGMTALLSEEVPGATNHLRKIFVDVAWEEGNQRMGVRRVTFAFDAEKAAANFWGEDANGAADEEAETR